MIGGGRLTAIGYIGITSGHLCRFHKECSLVYVYMFVTIISSYSLFVLLRSTCLCM